MRGEMIWFNEKKDHGFIRTEGGERLAVAGAGFAGGARPVGRCAQRVVTFEIDDSGVIRQARNVAFEPEVQARRARRRSGRAVRSH
jgi:hypothetical protein